MSASTALMGFYLANARENKDNESASLLKRSVNPDNFISAQALRSKEIAAIQAIFANIRKKLEDTDENDALIHSILKDLLDASNAFEKTLIDEINATTKNINRSRITALHYQSTVNDVLNTNKNLVDKTHSVSEFRSHARGSKISNSKRHIIGAVIGALFSSAFLLGILAVSGGLALATGPAGVAVLAVGLLICIGFGAAQGAIAANRVGKNPEEKRGQAVSKHLDRLAVAKNRFFLPPRKLADDIVSTDSMKLK